MSAMIKATFEKEEGQYLSLTIEGHAGQAEKGNDIVCSAASILAYTLAQTITQMDKQEWLKKKPHINLKEGNGLITCIPNEGYFDECLMAFFVAEVGYSLLANNYPQYVEIIPFGEA
jgi:uncharacterized protein YsxB (DUF464 family)